MYLYIRTFCLVYTVNLTRSSHLILLLSLCKVISLQELGKTEKIKSKIMTLEWLCLSSYVAMSVPMTRFKKFLCKEKCSNHAHINYMLCVRLRYSRRRMTNCSMCVIFFHLFWVPSMEVSYVAIVIWPCDEF